MISPPLPCVSPLVFVIAEDPARLDVLEAAAAQGAGCAPARFSRIDDARDAVALLRPELIVAPWCDAGASALGFQRDLRQAAEGAAPYLLIATSGVSPTKISLAARAGRSELIPDDPLDPAALSNRVTLLLWGAEALGDRLWGAEETDADARPRAGAGAAA